MLVNNYLAEQHFAVVTAQFNLINSHTSRQILFYHIIITFQLTLFRQTQNMKKNFITFHPQRSPKQPFTILPLHANNQEIKSTQNKLRKIGRNKLQFKELNLPKLRPVRNKQNQDASLQEPISTAQLSSAKDQSLRKLDRIYPEHKLYQMAHTQKLDKGAPEQNKIKELALKKSFFIRDKRVVIQRNCMSAELKKQNKEFLPASIKGIRQKMCRKQSQVSMQEQKMKNLKLSEQAGMMAQQLQCSSGNEKRGMIPTLEDFLNKWIERH